MIVKETISFTRGEADVKKSLVIGKAFTEKEVLSKIQKVNWKGEIEYPLPTSVDELGIKDYDLNHHMDIKIVSSIIEEGSESEKEVIDRMVERIFTFPTPSKFNFQWIWMFAKLDKLDRVYPDPRWYFETHGMRILSDIDRNKFISSVKKFPANKEFQIGLDTHVSELIMDSLKRGATNTDIDNNIAIQRAAENGDDILVQELLQNPYVDPTSNTTVGKRYDQDEHHYAIRGAAKNGHLHVVNLLMKDGRTDPSYRDNYALKSAVSNKDIEMCKLLLTDERVRRKIPLMPETVQKKISRLGILESINFERGKDPKASMGIGREKMIGDFVDEVNQSINDKNISGWRLDKNDKNEVLLKAATLGRADIVRMLLSDPDTNPNYRKNTVLESAAASGSVETVDILLKDSRVNPATNHNETLRRAVLSGELSVVKRLLEDPRVNPADSRSSLDKNLNPVTIDNYIIMDAIHPGRISIAEELLKDPRVNPTKALKYVLSGLFSTREDKEKSIYKWLPFFFLIIDSPNLDLSPEEIEKTKNKVKNYVKTLKP